MCGTIKTLFITLFFMRWNDIKNRFAPQKPAYAGDAAVVDSVRTVTGNPLGSGKFSEEQKHRMVIGGIFLVIIASGITLFLIFRSKSPATYQLTEQDMLVIDGFFAQNPPQPISQEENQVIEAFISQPVELSQQEDQIINRFLGGR